MTLRDTNLNWQHKRIQVLSVSHSGSVSAPGNKSAKSCLPALARDCGQAGPGGESGAERKAAPDS
jgi:hypothetical protein